MPHAHRTGARPPVPPRRPRGAGRRGPGSAASRLRSSSVLARARRRREPLQALLERVDGSPPGLHALDVALVLGAEDLLQQSVEHVRRHYTGYSRANPRTRRSQRRRVSASSSRACSRPALVSPPSMRAISATRARPARSPRSPADRPALNALGDTHVVAGSGGDLGQVGHAQDLPPRRRPPPACRRPPRPSVLRCRRRPRRRSWSGLRRRRPARRGGRASCATARRPRRRAPGPWAPRRDSRRGGTPRGPARARSCHVEAAPLEGDPEDARSMPRTRISRSTRAWSRRAAAAARRVDSSVAAAVSSASQLGQHRSCSTTTSSCRASRSSSAAAVVTEGEHGLLAVAVLALEPREGVEALVDRFQATGLYRESLRAAARTARRASSSCTRRRRGVLGRRGERGDRGGRGPGVPGPRGASRASAESALVVELRLRPRPGRPAKRSACCRRRRSARSSSSSPGRRRAASSSAHLEAQKVLPLGAIALGRPRAAPAPRRAARYLAWSRRTRLASSSAPAKRSSRSSWCAGLEKPLVLVLAVDLDEVIAESLQERDRHRRIVDERAMPSGARQLAADDDLSVVGGQARLVEHRGGRALGLDLEQRLDGADSASARMTSVWARAPRSRSRSHR